MNTEANSAEPCSVIGQTVVWVGPSLWLDLYLSLSLSQMLMSASRLAEQFAGHSGARTQSARTTASLPVSRATGSHRPAAAWVSQTAGGSKHRPMEED